MTLSFECHLTCTALYFTVNLLEKVVNLSTKMNSGALLNGTSTF